MFQPHKRIVDGIADLDVYQSNRPLIVNKVPRYLLIHLNQSTLNPETDPITPNFMQ